MACHGWVSMALWLALNIHASNTITRHRTTDNVVCSSLWRPSFIKADSLSCRAGKLPHPANPHDINFRVRLHRPYLFMGCPAVSPRHCRVLRHKNPRPVGHRPRNCPPRATGPTGLWSEPQRRTQDLGRTRGTRRHRSFSMLRDPGRSPAKRRARHCGRRPDTEAPDLSMLGRHCRSPACNRSQPSQRGLGTSAGRTHSISSRPRTGADQAKCQTGDLAAPQSRGLRSWPCPTTTSAEPAPRQGRNARVR